MSYLTLPLHDSSYPIFDSYLISNLKLSKLTSRYTSNTTKCVFVLRWQATNIRQTHDAQLNS